MDLVLLLGSLFGWFTGDVFIYWWVLHRKWWILPCFCMFLCTWSKRSWSDAVSKDKAVTSPQVNQMETVPLCSSIATASQFLARLKHVEQTAPPRDWAESTHTLTLPSQGLANFNNKPCLAVLTFIKLYSKSLTSSYGPAAEWSLNIRNKAFKPASTHRHFYLWRAGQDEILTPSPWHSFSHTLALVSTGSVHNRKLNSQSKRREPSAHLCWARPGPHHLPPTASTSCSQTPHQNSAQKYIIKYGIKWEQPQT